MINNILDIINANNTIDEFLIKVVNTTSTELFFIKDQLQMSRGKDVSHIYVTVYKNFEDNGFKYKGSSTTKIAPTMKNDEINSKLNNAILSAAFVKNEYFDLVSPTNITAPILKSSFSEGSLTEQISNLVQDLYSKENSVEGANINSCEFFINKNITRLINSSGLDIEFTSFNGQIELITEAKSDLEEVELFDVLNFSDYDPEWIKNNVKSSLQKTLLRTKAVQLSQMKDIPVILTGDAVRTFFSYYTAKASGSLKYEGISELEIGDKAQTGNIIGDKVTLSLVPFLTNSTASRYYDNDGYFLQDVILVEGGLLKQYQASKQYADYLNIKPTGIIGNTVVQPGTKSCDEIKRGKYLELLNFSDFQMDPMTGDFGGEIRLGIYHDGDKEIPITLGSISGNAKTVESNMYFSKELQQRNRFFGPKLIKLRDVTIAGN